MRAIEAQQGACVENLDRMNASERLIKGICIFLLRASRFARSGYAARKPAKAGNACRMSPRELRRMIRILGEAFMMEFWIKLFLSDRVSNGPWDRLQLLPARRRENRLSFRNALFRVIRALDVNIRPEFTQNAIYSQRIKQQHIIHAVQRGKNLRTLRLRLERPSFSFQSSHSGVGVNAQNQHISQSFGILQISNMPYMDKIEAAIGEHDLPSGSAQARFALSSSIDFTLSLDHSCTFEIRDSKFEIMDRFGWRYAAHRR